MPPTIKTVKRLFAFSANQCAIPACDRSIVQPDGAVTGEICHIASRQKNGPRYDPLLTENECDSFENLILLCETHHKIIDTNVRKYTVELLRQIKLTHEKQGYIEISPQDEWRSRLLLKSLISVKAEPNSKVIINSPGAMQADTITIVTRRKKVVVQPHVDSIAADLDKRGYVKYLIDRYNRFQKADEAKIGRGKYIVIYNAIKGKFGRKWDEIPLMYFDELATYLQNRIIKTKLGRNLNAKKRRCFSLFDEWLIKPEKA